MRAPYFVTEFVSWGLIWLAFAFGMMATICPYTHLEREEKLL